MAASGDIQTLGPYNGGSCLRPNLDRPCLIEASSAVAFSSLAVSRRMGQWQLGHPAVGVVIFGPLFEWHQCLNSHIHRCDRMALRLAPGDRRQQVPTANDQTALPRSGPAYAKMVRFRFYAHSIIVACQTGQYSHSDRASLVRNCYYISID